MSRHGRIIDALETIKDEGLIDGWVKDTDPSNPNKANWIVQLSKFQTRRWETGTVEAFIDGVNTALIRTD